MLYDLSEYAEGTLKANILRTIEAMYGLPKSGKQLGNATRAGITDDTIVTDVFAPAKQAESGNDKASNPTITTLPLLY